MLCLYLIVGCENKILVLDSDVSPVDFYLDDRNVRYYYTNWKLVAK